MIRSPVVITSLLLSFALPARAVEPSPVVVELFTSEGCSSCPPADSALARLERNQPVPGTQIIPLGFHVDYWNRLGWSDPYSSSAFSLRQQAYSDAFGGDRVYTPQMVVDGSSEFIGSESLAIRAVAAAAAATHPKARVEIVLSPRCVPTPEVRVSVGELTNVSPTDRTELLVAVAESGLTSQVTRGENAGKTLRHTAVVRHLRSLGELKPEDGKAGKPLIASAQLTLDKAWKRDSLQVVAFLQQRKSRHIVGAAVQRLCE